MEYTENMKDKKSLDIQISTTGELVYDEDILNQKRSICECSKFGKTPIANIIDETKHYTLMHKDCKLRNCALGVLEAQKRVAGEKLN